MNIYVKKTIWMLPSTIIWRWRAGRTENRAFQFERRIDGENKTNWEQFYITWLTLYSDVPINVNRKVPDTEVYFLLTNKTVALVLLKSFYSVHGVDCFLIYCIENLNLSSYCKFPVPFFFEKKSVVIQKYTTSILEILYIIQKANKCSAIPPALENKRGCISENFRKKNGICAFTTWYFPVKVSKTRFMPFIITL
ncbi:hypothetical protein BY458DRAFT_495051 [Sporodiniella umbellata]|nr:hypothetical protein BY458DRAFT_495051 [Sporodiniella umbellata]